MAPAKGPWHAIRMAMTGAAPAPTRAILGPCATQAGFQYWYLACFPDCIVAVRQGIWSGLLLAMSGTAPAHGLIGGLAGYLLKEAGQKRRLKVEAGIAGMPTSSLQAKPNLTYRVSQLRSITFKSKSFGTLITPDITLETTDGAKQKFGIQKPDFEKARAQLQQMYSTLCR